MFTWIIKIKIIVVSKKEAEVERIEERKHVCMFESKEYRCNLLQLKLLWKLFPFHTQREKKKRGPKTTPFIDG